MNASSLGRLDLRPLKMLALLAVVTFLFSEVWKEFFPCYAWEKSLKREEPVDA